MVIDNPPQQALARVVGRNEWRQQLVRDFDQTAARLQDAYTRALPRVRESIQVVEQRIAKKEDITVDDFRNLREWKRFQTTIEAELNDFMVIARNETAALEESAITLAARAAKEQTVATAGRFAGEVTAQWLDVAPETLQEVIRFADHPAQRAIFSQFGPDGARDVADLTLSMIAQGKGPLSIANAMEQWLRVPFAWAINSARTLQIYSYRGATQAAYRENSHIVEDWMWWMTFDQRVCPSCVAAHGKRFPHTETLNDHHSGRCVPIPVIHGARWPENVERGRDWFDRQPDDIQRKIFLNNRLLEGLREKRVTWEEIVGNYQHPVYGTMRRAKSAREVGLPARLAMEE